MIGFPEQELLQMDVLAITHPNDVQESREFMHALTKGVTSSSTITKRCLRKDGDSVWTCAHVTLERDPQGKPLHFIALIEDLTERKRAEENARRSEESLGFTLDAVGIGLCHRESGETMASDHQFRLYGIEPAEKWLTRERWLQSIHPEDRERVETEQRLAMEQGKPYVIWFRVVWPDGSVHWLACRGKVFGTRKMEVTIDVTERKRAEAALEGFFALSRSPMSICGFDGTIKRVNAALLETSGFTAEELAQRLAPEFFHSDDRAMIQEQFQKLIAQGGDTEFECRGLRRDGSCCWLLFFATAAPDEKLIFTVAYDVTERKRMTEDLKLNVEKLARSNEELERFAYVASHDLQEPLRMVASFTQLLAKRYSGRLDETADRYINYAVDGAKRMQQLIADLLAYSRVNSQELNLSQTDCETVVLGAMRNLEVAIKESGAAIDWDPLPVLWADQRQLILLFQNLLANAIKFRRKDECPRIHVSSVDSDAEWIISVQDNGIGIDARHAERIFQVFQRLHTRQEYPGTGIGLAVCKKVVERHGGKLWVEAEPGAGCTFRFTIPKPKINGTGDHSANQTVRDSVD
jgi:PAS domain S-box-containing protein